MLRHLTAQHVSLCKISPIICGFFAFIIRSIPIWGDAKPTETVRHHITIPSAANRKKHMKSNVGAMLVTNFQVVSENNKRCFYYDPLQSEWLLTVKFNAVIVIYILLLKLSLPRPFQNIVHSRLYVWWHLIRVAENMLK